MNKQTEIDPKCRSRLIIQEFENESKPELYAIIFPFECQIMIRSTVVNHMAEQQDNTSPMTIMMNDVGRAYFYVFAVRPIYVQFVDEDRQPNDEDICGRLNVSMHGTRDAALNWHEHCRDHLMSLGFIEGRASPRLLYNKYKKG